MHLKKRLSSIQGKQEESKRALAEHEQLEEQLEAFHQREMRLFGWLHEVWRKDKELRDSLEHDRLELQHEQRKIVQKLHDKKQTFTKKKLHLLNAEEEELSKLRRLEIREE